ncbi:EamA family transporter [Zunongwangia endophytica]|uniref:DMT family transporter n=1 Tax=Zunongwangia endophytica TaxID=1808945 RepID=A0ABV8H6C0_9FLAO|nr:DMT family transporter [Zunongwangia endophytica]MDN3595953.1 DMT family transporter [Zunongwangia endophytica]
MNSSLKGMFFIAVGASCYGVLATFVKYANNNGFGTAGLAFSQYLFGVLLLSIISLIFSKNSKSSTKSHTISKFPKIKLILFGTTLGLTSSFYYLSIQYVPVSVGIILLMQTIWMGVVLEYFMARHLITKTKVLGALVAIVGTVFAAQIFEADMNINFIGIGFGLLAALSYTGAMYASNNVSLELPVIIRSKYLVYGGFLVVVAFWNVQILEEFNAEVFLKWGAFLGFFGTILPPILFNKGFPEIGTGLGSIIAALEIPVSVFSAYLVLNEEISLLQWLGIVIILFAIILINWRKLIRNRKG